MSAIACTSCRTLAIGLGDLAKFEKTHLRTASLRLRIGMSGSGARARRLALQPAVDGIEPADDRVEPEQLGVDDEGEPEVVLTLVLFQPGPLLHQLDEVPPVNLHDVLHVDARDPSADSTLITSSSRGGTVRSVGVMSHVGELLLAGDGDPEPFWGPSGSAPSDSTSPSRSRRWRVVYTWPTLSGQTSPVFASNSCRSWWPYFGLLAQQPEQGVFDAHLGSPRELNTQYGTEPGAFEQVPLRVACRPREPGFEARSQCREAPSSRQATAGDVPPIAGRSSRGRRRRRNLLAANFVPLSYRCLRVPSGARAGERTRTSDPEGTGT